MSKHYLTMILKIFLITSRKNHKISPLSQNSFLKDFSIQDISCELVKKQSVSQIDMEPITGNPLEFAFFMSIFHKSIKMKIDDPKDRLTRPIKHNRGKQHGLLKHYQSHYQTVDIRKFWHYSTFYSIFMLEKRSGRRQS